MLLGAVYWGQLHFVSLMGLIIFEEQFETWDGQLFSFSFLPHDIKRLQQMPNLVLEQWRGMEIFTFTLCSRLSCTGFQFTTMMLTGEYSWEMKEQ